MKTLRKPDLNAPRFRKRWQSALTVETFKEFQKKHPQYKDLSLKEYKEIVNVFNSKIKEGVINNRNGIELPEGLGFIFMGSCPQSKKKNVDYSKSLKYGVEAIHKNWESDNRLLKIFYTNYNTKYPFANKQVWSFKAGKQFIHEASIAFRENWQKYIEVEPKEKISAMFDKYRKKERIKNMEPVVPEGYDEFNF